MSEIAPKSVPALTVRVIADEGEFLALKSRWDQLLQEAVDPNTFLSHAWLHSWWICYQPSTKLSLLIVERGAELRGVAPLMASREMRHCLPLRVLRFVGDGTSETDHMSFLVAQSERVEVVAMLLAAIREMEWDVLELNQMPRDSTNTVAVVQFAENANWLLAVTEVECPTRTIPKDLDSLLRAMPSRFRTSVRTALRKTREMPGVEFGQHTEESEFPDALSSLFRNHASRWMMKGQSGVFSDPRKQSFYATLTSLLHRNGSLRFFYLRIDGQVVAQQYCFQHAGTVYLLQEGFDPQFARMNVGNVLRANVFEHLMADGVEKYDFLAGSSRHKRNWTDGSAWDLRLMIARRTLRGMIAFHLPILLERIKAAVKRLLPRSAGSAEVSAGAD